MVELINKCYYFLINNNKNNITLYYILNNSSCDMDSFVSSILLSLVKNIREGVLILNIDNVLEFNENTNKIYLPLMNCKRGDLKTRLDIAFTMNKFKINEDDLFYINDEDIINKLFLNKSETPSKTNKLILVDHNSLDQNKLNLIEFVEEIYDHHYDNNLTNKIDYNNLITKNLKFPLGSCSTLILLDYVICDEFVKFNFNKFIDPLFSLTAILQDTENFKKEFYKNRWVDLDLYVFRTIIQQENLNENSINEYYNNLCNSKYDENANLNLGLESLMNKDKKIFKWIDFNIVWSSLQISLQSLNNKYGWNELINYFENENLNSGYKIDFFVTISSFSNSISNSKIVLIYDFKNILCDNDSSDYLSNLNNYLSSSLGDKFKSLKKKKMFKNIIKLFLDVTLSRKLLEPILKNYFEKVLKK